VRIRRVAGRQASRPLLIGLKVGRTLKRTSGLNKLMSIVHKMSMEFESKCFDGMKAYFVALLCKGVFQSIMLFSCSCMHKQGPAFGVSLAKLSKPVRATHCHSGDSHTGDGPLTKEGTQCAEACAEKVMVIDAQLCQVCTGAVLNFKYILLIMDTCTVPLSADFKIANNSLRMSKVPLYKHLSVLALNSMCTHRRMAARPPFFI